VRGEHRTQPVKQRAILSTLVCNHPVFEPEVSGVFYMDIIYEIRLTLIMPIHTNKSGIRSLITVSM